MDTYSVQLFERGIMDKVEPRQVEASSAVEAVALVCDEPLRDGGKPGQLRAVVWPLNRPRQKSTFYRLPSSS